MGEDKALLYPLAGVFSVILSLPLLLFWKPASWAKTLVIFALLGSILLSWWLFDLSAKDVDLQQTMFVITLLPPVVAAALAGVVEIRSRLRRLRGHSSAGNHHGHRRHRRHRSASVGE